MNLAVLALSLGLYFLTDQEIVPAFGDPMVNTSPGSLFTQIQSPGKKLFRATGVVIDVHAGIVTIANEPVPGLMGAMNMDYKVSPKSLVYGLQSGDRVSFLLDGDDYTIVSLSKETQGH